MIGPNLETICLNSLKFIKKSMITEYSVNYYIYSNACGLSWNFKEIKKGLMSFTFQIIGLPHSRIWK